MPSLFPDLNTLIADYGDTAKVRDDLAAQLELLDTVRAVDEATDESPDAA